MSYGPKRLRGFAVAFWFTLSAPGFAAWVELASPNFELYTDAGEKAGRRTLVRLEQIRQVFRDIGGDRRESPLPVRVYLFASEKDFAVYRPATSVKGFYQGGPERNYIVLVSSEESSRVVFHEYIHLVLNHTSARLPKWFEEGLSEFYSTVEPLRDKLIIGKPVASHVRTLMEAAWLDAATFAGVTGESRVYNDHEQAGVYYAQSWALVHMLNLMPAYRDRMADYAGRIADGEPADSAFSTAFGKPLAAALVDLQAYVRGGRWPRVETAWDAPETVTVDVRPLAETETQLALTDLQLQLGLWDVSEKTLVKLAASQGSSIEIETARAMVAMSRRDFTAAKERLDKAIELGSRKATTYFEYAMLLRETGAQPALVAANLQRTVELNPNFAEAHFLLGVMASADGHPEKAIDSLRRATALLPRQASFWHALSLACHETGQNELARRAARRALEAAVTEQETAMAKAALQLASKPAAQPPPPRPAVTTPESWSNRQGDGRIEGTLEQIDCLGRAARFHIREGARTVALFVANPGEVLLKNASSLTFEFSCGKQSPRQVTVEYLTKQDPATNTAGELTAIDFR